MGKIAAILDQGDTMMARTWLSVVAIVLAAILIGCTGNVFDIAVGECLGELGEGEVTDVEKEDCSEPHDSEVYAAFDLPGGDYPGVDGVQEVAFVGCLERFEGFVGNAYQSSTLDVTWLAPSPESWSDGDREVICMVYDLEGGKLTGSMEDSGA